MSKTFFNFREWSMTARILVPTLVVSFTLLCLFGAIVITQKLKSAEHALQSKLGSMSTFLTQASLSYYENYDTPALRAFTKTITLDSDFEGLVFIDKDGKPLTAELETTAPFVESAIQGGDQKSLGALRLYYRPTKSGFDAVIQESDRIWLAVIGGILFVELILGLFVLFIVRSSVQAFTKQFTDLGQASGVLRGASESLEESNADLSQVFEEQAASIRGAASTLDEIATVAQNSQSEAKESASNALKTKELIGSIQHAFHSMAVASDDLSETNERTISEIQANLSELNEVVKIISEIEAKTKVINEIVFQTRLLSFNASVEAARAGESGRGFAVVAEEVGSLAHMSGKSSKEISDLLQQSTTRVYAILKKVEQKIQETVTQGKGKSEASKAVAEKGTSTVNSIVTQIAEFADSVSRIAGSFEEQSRAVQNINRAINEIHEASVRSQGRLHLSMETSGQLKDQSSRLVTVVDALEQEVHGRRTA